MEMRLCHYLISIATSFVPLPEYWFNSFPNLPRLLAKLKLRFCTTSWVHFRLDQCTAEKLQWVNNSSWASQPSFLCGDKIRWVTRRGIIGEVFSYQGSLRGGLSLSLSRTVSRRGCWWAMQTTEATSMLSHNPRRASFVSFQKEIMALTVLGRHHVHHVESGDPFTSR